MRIVEISDTAKDDLRNIWEYVAQYNPESANKLIKDITKKFSLLRDYPLMGKTQDALLINLRSFAFKDYLIFYQPIDGGVEILRVLHGSRDIESIFEIFFDSL